MQKSVWLLSISFAVVFLYGSQEAPVGRPFANPPMLSSRDGQLHVDLIAAPSAYAIIAAALLLYLLRADVRGTFVARRAIERCRQTRPWRSSCGC
jgi:hypothetical protein